MSGYKNSITDINGNVGIGTTSPDKQLEILYPSYIDKDTVEGLLRLTGQSNTENAGDVPSAGVGIEFYNKWAGGDPFSIGRISARASQSYDGGLQFDVSQNTGAGQTNFITAMTILDTGKVGIGTDSPSYTLAAYANTTGSKIVASFGASLDQNQFTAIGLSGFIASNGATKAGIALKRTGVYGTGELHFLNNNTLDNSDITLSDSKMMIDGSGKVGIGTDSPVKKLHVKETSGTYEAAIFETNSDGSFIRNIDSTGAVETGIQGGKWSARTSNTQRLVIDSSGNVGIGTDSPDALLEVSKVTSAAIRITSTGNGLGAGNTIGSLEYYGNDISVPGAGIKSSIVAKTEASLGDDSNLIFSTSDGTTNNVERMRITSGGDVLFGTTGVPNGTSVYGAGFINTSSVNSVLKTATNSTGAVNLIEFYNPNGLVGKIRTNGTATDYVTGSDYRLKEDLQDFAGLDMVSKIPVYDFKWKTDESRSYGVMAHELQDVLPDAVTGEKDAEEMQGVDYSKIVPLLIKSIQELKAEIDILKAK